MILDTHVRTPMRDGVELASFVARPETSEDSAVPLILERSPYYAGAMRAMSAVPGLAGRPEMMLLGFAANVGLDLQAILDAGFAVAVTECRGTGRSGGSFRWMAQEGEDGVDLAAWFSQQPWCSGVLGWGPSYRSGTQLATVLSDPSAMTAISPWLAPSPTPATWAGRGGVPEFAPTISWALDRIRDAADRGDVEIVDPLPPRNDALSGILEHDAEYWADLLDHYPQSRHAAASLRGVSAGVAAGCYAEEELEALAVPAFHLAGWYDVFLGGTLRNYTAMRRGPASEDQHLVIGPWTHVDQVGRIPGYPFAPESTLSGGGIPQRQLDFWRRHGLGEQVDLPRVRLFLMGADEWMDADEWPVTGTQELTLFICDDALVEETPTQAGHTDWDHDPTHPVPTAGGQMLLGRAGDLGPIDQRKVESRSDVVSFSTEPVAEGVEVVGPVSARLFVSSDAPTVHLHATLTDVAPDGRSTILTDGACRVETSDGVVDVEMDLWATGNRFLPGHRIRLNIAASNWPRYLAEPHAGTVRLHTGPETPSQVRLPLLPTRPTDG